MHSAGQLREGLGKGCGWASLKLPALNLPLLCKHCFVAELEMKRFGGGSRLCSRVEWPQLGEDARSFTRCITPASRFCLEELEDPH